MTNALVLQWVTMWIGKVSIALGSPAKNYLALGVTKMCSAALINTKDHEIRDRSCGGVKLRFVDIDGVFRSLDVDAMDRVSVTFEDNNSRDSGAWISVTQRGGLGSRIQIAVAQAYDLVAEYVEYIKIEFVAHHDVESEKMLARFGLAGETFEQGIFAEQRF